METFIQKSPFPVYYVKDDKLDIRKKIGEGIYEVFKIRFNDKDYAGKVYTKFRDNDIICELEIAKKLVNTKQSVKTFGVIYTDNKLIILMEILKGHGDLYDYIQKENLHWKRCYMDELTKKLYPSPKTDYIYYNKEEDIYWCFGLSTSQKIKIIKSFVKSICELHDEEIIHGDIKTNNVVLHNQYKKQIIKLIDFGMSYHSKENNMIDLEYKSGTLGYRAPEQESYQMNKKSDIYSMGVTIIEIWNGDIWYDGDNFKECRKEVLRGLRTIEKKHREIGKLIRKSISLNNKNRPTSKEFLFKLEKIINENDHIYKNNHQN